MINLAAVVLSTNLNSSTFMVTRDPGSSVQGGGYFGRGGFVQAATTPNSPATFSAIGVVTPAEAEMLSLLDEGDRISSTIQILTTTQLKVSSEGPPSTEADIITWQGLHYKVTRVFPWTAYGYCEALATQITTA